MSGMRSGFPVGMAMAIVGVATGLDGIPAAAQPASGTDAAIEVLHVNGNVYLFAGPGGNTTAQLGPEGILLVDTQYEAVAPRLLEAAAGLSRGPLRYLVNTHAHPDHTYGNAWLRAHAPDTNLEPLAVIAHINTFLHMTQAEQSDPDVPEGLLPLESYDAPSMDLYFNGEGVMIYHAPSAHTDGDSIVWFRGSDVVSTGDVFVPGAYPFIDIARGGSVNGLIGALNHVLHITIPAKTQEGGTYVIPGHGRICDEADVVEYRDMVVIVRDRIQAMIDDGLSLRQIQRARPTLDYDTEYVDATSFVSAEQFVESIYRSLTVQ
jgi:glyoxylase-like metal-dependent hydrolase (beta-lactamase superfamily II)